MTAILALLAAASVGSTAPARAPGFTPAKYQKKGWVARCHAADDGFAANCEARKTDGGFTFRLLTADAHFYVFLEHPACSVEPRGFSREEMVGLRARDRRKQIINTFDLLDLDLHQACPKLPPVPRSFVTSPDIAIAGEEALR
ncbi:MAG TPA: hypothetical protein VGD10_09000 [Allosphingosinicella sp.]|uniref:hypothetical protein n=1 Tax=Allosphingosinicella sp. TaxID=2823234 RepID=UPI002ED7DF61